MNHRNTEARIYVGTDRSQLLAVKVLEHSIARHTDLKVSVTPMHDLVLPDPVDLRQSKRTGFSFTRFAIPELAGWTGRALYLDADMLVFRDLREIYDLPFNGCKVLIQQDLPEEAVHPTKASAPKQRIKQCSVMMLDCAALDWRASEIIAGLDGRYTYEDLMWRLCILNEEEIGYAIPFSWNSLEMYREGETGLIHYTDMPTQPWVCPSNPFGYVWLNEVRRMLSSGAMRREEIEHEIALGYMRPSLIEEIAVESGDGPPGKSACARLEEIDRKAGFVPHREVMEKKRLRDEAVARYKAGLDERAKEKAPPPGGLIAGLRQRIGL